MLDGLDLPPSHGTSMEKSEEKLESMERTLTGGTGEDRIATLYQHGTGDLLASWCKTRREEVGRWLNVL